MGDLFVDLGRVLQAAREAQGLSREQFAHRVGSTPQTIWNYENARQGPGQWGRDYPRFLDALGASVDVRLHAEGGPEAAEAAAIVQAAPPEARALMLRVLRTIAEHRR
jgi:transcriptional regulator with XRE-family HTH domain